MVLLVYRQLSQNLNLAGAFTISFDFSLIGCIEISDKVFTDKNGNNILKFVSASVTFDAMAHFDFTKHNFPTSFED